MVQADLKAAFSKYFGFRISSIKGKFGDVHFSFGGREGSDLIWASFEAMAGLLDASDYEVPGFKGYLTMGQGYYKLTRQYDPDREGWGTALGLHMELKLFKNLWCRLSYQTQEYRNFDTVLYGMSIGLTYTFHKRNHK